MVRKLAMAVSLAVGTLPLSVYALGLGEIKTSSVLNEKFEAEIELLSVKKGELDTIKVGLAPPEVFSQTGVERPYLLSQLHFKPVRTRDGRTVIRVTSKVPIREPFLDFFVQLAWPNGQLVREYTVLLDPPVVTRRRAPAVAAPGTPAVPAAKKVERKVVRASSRAPKPERYRDAVASGEYGPVRSNEALWNIADGLRPAGVSIHQMMVALYKANPGAFLNGDINLLKKGQVLRIPQEEEIRGISRRQAREEFARLSEGWIATPEAPVAAEAPVAPVTAPSGEKSAEAGQKIDAAPETAAEEARLKIAGGEEETGIEPEAAEGAASGSGRGGEALRQKLLLVEEQAETARQEAATLRERMDSLESQLEDMKRLLKLRNEELARLQAQAAGGGVTTGEQSAGEETGRPEEVAAEEPPAEAVETVEAEASVPSNEAAIPNAVEPPLEDLEEVVGEGGAMEAEEPGAREEAEVEEALLAGGEPDGAGQEPRPSVTEPAKPQPPAAPAPPAGEAWFRWLSDNWKLVAGGGGVVLLGLLGLAFARRRKENEAGELPPSASMPRPESREAESILEDEDATALQAATDSAMGDTSFLSEYSTEELRALHDDTVDVDPVSEADVYIAYGRYSQAEEILNAAIKNGDNSAAVRHKMLEVYYATQKKDEFRKLAEEMKAAGQDKEDPAAWEHIQTMGRDLDRSNPLFAAAAAAGVLEAGAETESGDSAVEPESDLSLDLSTLAEEVDSALSPESEPVDSFSNLDLELPSLEISPDTRQGEADGGDDGQEKSPKGGLDLHETELHTELADINDLGDLGIESNMLDDTLADLAGDLEEVMVDSRVLDEPLDLEDNTLSVLEDVDTSVPAAEELVAGDTSPEPEVSSDSRIGDEVETKLELAKAFLEIGDADGARSILHEVQEDGTPEQQQEAADLLAQLEG